MKKNLSALVVIVMASTMLASCWSYTTKVGKGAQTGVEVSAGNHYLLYGLVPLSTTEASELAGGAQDYTINVKHTFINGLLQSLTFGLYSPTTVTVTK